MRERERVRQTERGVGRKRERETFSTYFCQFDKSPGGNFFEGRHVSLTFSLKGLFPASRKAKRQRSNG